MSAGGRWSVSKPRKGRAARRSRCEPRRNVGATSDRVRAKLPLLTVDNGVRGWWKGRTGQENQEIQKLPGSQLSSNSGEAGMK